MLNSSAAAVAAVASPPNPSLLASTDHSIANLPSQEPSPQPSPLQPSSLQQLKSTPLLVVRRQLEALRDQLHADLVTLINRDYADFINLSVELNGLDVQLKLLRPSFDLLAEHLLAARAQFHRRACALRSVFEQRSQLQQQQVAIMERFISPQFNYC